MSQDPHELTAAYVLDAVDADERALVEAHLETCAACRQMVDELTMTAGELAGAAKATPSPSLKSSVMAAISDIEQERPRPAEPETSTAANRDEQVRAHGDEQVIDMASSPAARRRWSPRSLLTVAAALIGLLIAGVMVVNVVRDEPTDQVAAIAEADDAIEVPLEGEASVRVVYSPSHSEAALLADGIAPLEADRVYELWAVAGDESVIRAGEFVPDDDGRLAGLVDDSRFELESVGTWVITIEPAGGVDVATGEPIYVGDVSA